MAVNFELAEEEPVMSSERDEVMELLQRRDAVQGWLDRLEAQRGTANAKVLDRVRLDYESRLRDTLQALSKHREAIQQELTAARQRLAQAEREQSEASDGLEEGHLRHRIGELAEEEWDRQRVRLEEAAEKASAVERESAADVSRLEELLGQLEHRGDEVGAGEVDEEEDEVGSAPPSAPLNLADDEDVTLEAAGTDGFLADIDRALADPAADVEAAVDPEALPEEEGGDTAPKKGLKCPECGYTNDISAWFCGVCGADIG